MQKHQLANELRLRQYDAGLVERRLVDALSDDEMIDAYITCSHCGAKEVNEEELREAILLAQDADEFFQFCGEFAEDRHRHAGEEG